MWQWGTHWGFKTTCAFNAAALRLLFHIRPHDGNVRLQLPLFFHLLNCVTSDVSGFLFERVSWQFSISSALRVLRNGSDKRSVAGTRRPQRRFQTCFREADASVTATCGEFKDSSDEVRAMTLTGRNSEVCLFGFFFFFRAILFVRANYYRILLLLLLLLNIYAPFHYVDWVLVFHDNMWTN